MSTHDALGSSSALLANAAALLGAEAAPPQSPERYGVPSPTAGSTSLLLLGGSPAKGLSAGRRRIAASVSLPNLPRRTADAGLGAGAVGGAPKLGGTRPAYLSVSGTSPSPLQGRRARAPRALA